MKFSELFKKKQQTCKSTLDSVPNEDPSIIEAEISRFKFLKQAEDVTLFHNTLEGGLMICKSGEKWGLVDEDGRWVLPCVFDAIQREFGIGRIIIRYKSLVFDTWLNGSCVFSEETPDEIWSRYTERKESNFWWKMNDYGFFFCGNISPCSYSKDFLYQPSCITLSIPTTAELTEAENEEYRKTRDELFSIMEKTNGFTRDELDEFYKKYLRIKDNMSE